MSDAISRKSVLALRCTDCPQDDCLKKQNGLIYPCCAYAVKSLPSVQPSNKSNWIPLTSRPMTDEEKEYYSEQLDYCDGDAVIYDCPLPEEGEDVLISTRFGVLVDVFFNDYDGCGFEGYDIEDVTAWMSLPEPYEPQESEDKG